MELINRIRRAYNAGCTVEDIHDAIMGDTNPPTEGEFFLAWNAVQILDS